jgi:hypothetical protein
MYIGKQNILYAFVIWQGIIEENIWFIIEVDLLMIASVIMKSTKISTNVL